MVIMKKYIALLLLVSLSTAQAMPLSTALTLCKTYGSAALQLAKTVATEKKWSLISSTTQNILTGSTLALGALS